MKRQQLDAVVIIKDEQGSRIVEDSDHQTRDILMFQHNVGRTN